MVMTAELGSNGHIRFRGPPIKGRLASTLRTSSSVPVVSGPRRASRNLYLSNKVSSSIPISLTRRLNFSGVIMVEAHGHRCHGGPNDGTVRGTVRVGFGRCPSFIGRIGNEPRTCGGRTRRLRGVRRSGRVFYVTPGRPIGINQLRRGIGGLGSLCRDKCTSTGRSFSRVVRCLRRSRGSTRWFVRRRTPAGVNTFLSWGEPPTTAFRRCFIVVGFGDSFLDSTTL